MPYDVGRILAHRDRLLWGGYKPHFNDVDLWNVAASAGLEEAARQDEVPRWLRQAAIARETLAPRAVAPIADVPRDDLSIADIPIVDIPRAAAPSPMLPRPTAAPVALVAARPAARPAVPTRDRLAEGLAREILGNSWR